MKNSPISKTLLVIVVLAALAIIGFIFYTHHSTQDIVVHTVSEVKPLLVAGEWPSMVVRDQTITDTASYYTISAVYPVTKDNTINDAFKSYVDTAIAQFKDDTSWAAGDGAKIAPAEAASLSLTITYTEQKSTRADNYIFSTTTYTGGAHGLESTKTFVFSPTGQQISVASLFSNGIVGLKTIAPYVKAQLTASLPRSDQSFIADGTTPTEINYQLFKVLDDGIIVIFDPYQVAPYSDGQQTVKVPLSVFKSIASGDIFTIR
jgi:hypothetical protein